MPHLRKKRDKKGNWIKYDSTKEGVYGEAHPGAMGGPEHHVESMGGGYKPTQTDVNAAVKGLGTVDSRIQGNRPTDVFTRQIDRENKMDTISKATTKQLLRAKEIFASDHPDHRGTNRTIERALRTKTEGKDIELRKGGRLKRKPREFAKGGMYKGKSHMYAAGGRVMDTRRKG